MLFRSKLKKSQYEFEVGTDYLTLIELDISKRVNEFRVLHGVKPLMAGKYINKITEQRTADIIFRKELVILGLQKRKKN